MWNIVYAAFTAAFFVCVTMTGFAFVKNYRAIPKDRCILCIGRIRAIVVTCCFVLMSILLLVLLIFTLHACLHNGKIDIPFTSCILFPYCLFVISSPRTIGITLHQVYATTQVITVQGAQFDDNYHMVTVFSYSKSGKRRRNLFVIPPRKYEQVKRVLSLYEVQNIDAGKA